MDDLPQFFHHAQNPAAFKPLLSALRLYLLSVHQSERAILRSSLSKFITNMSTSDCTLIDVRTYNLVTSAYFTEGYKHDNTSILAFRQWECSMGDPTERWEAQRGVTNTEKALLRKWRRELKCICGKGKVRAQTPSMAACKTALKHLRKSCSQPDLSHVCLDEKKEASDELFEAVRAKARLISRRKSDTGLRRDSELEIRIPEDERRYRRKAVREFKESVVERERALREEVKGVNPTLLRLRRERAKRCKERMVKRGIEMAKWKGILGGKTVAQDSVTGKWV